MPQLADKRDFELPAEAVKDSSIEKPRYWPSGTGSGFSITASGRIAEPASFLSVKAVPIAIMDGVCARVPYFPPKTLSYRLVVATH